MKPTVQERIRYELHWPRGHRWLFCPWCTEYIDRRSKGRHSRWHYRPENVWTQEELDRAHAMGHLHHLFWTNADKEDSLGRPPIRLNDTEFEAVRQLLIDPPKPTQALIDAVARFKTRAQEQ